MEQTSIIIVSLYLMRNWNVVVSLKRQDDIHPCVRNCEGEAMTCEYEFQSQTYYTMASIACGDCPNTKEDCLNKKCVVGGGFKRTAQLVNKMFPGPTIMVCVNDTVIINLENASTDDQDTSIHYHGELQVGSPYMDGVPMVTQCPLLPHQTFTYRFVAQHIGTGFWHSHQRVQQGDGMFGMMVVKEPDALNPYIDDYDEDLMEHLISIIEWTHEPSAMMMAAMLYDNKKPEPDGILINGLGCIPPTKDCQFPVETFQVEEGKRYRFRFVNAASLNCPFSVSVDRHMLKIIATDGNYVQSRKAKHFVFHSGERIDVILEADQIPAVYFMRVKGLQVCADIKTFQVALLKYKESNHDYPKTAFPKFETISPKNPATATAKTRAEWNKENDSYDKQSRLIAELKNIKQMPNELATSDVHRVYLRLNIDGILTPNDENERFFYPMINNIRYADAPYPILLYYDRFAEDFFCNKESLANEGQNCTRELCECPHLIKLPLYRAIEFVLYDYGGYNKGNHPMHLHGHSFYLVARQASVGHSLTEEILKEMDEDGKIERNLKNPPEKDTVIVPRGGYVIIRFYTSNPGYWLFHCHIALHANEGMRMVVAVGEPDDIVPPPDGLIQCSI